MSNFILDHYMTVKAIHLIAVMSWMAGLLYLPRLFVYHAEAKTGSDVSKTFKTMEYRLLKYIMNPAMLATWVLGLLMFSANEALKFELWMQLKFIFIILMTVSHMAMGKYRRLFDQDQNTKSARFYRILNEVPTILMIIIVCLVVIKPS